MKGVNLCVMEILLHLVKPSCISMRTRPIVMSRAIVAVIVSNGYSHLLQCFADMQHFTVTLSKSNEDKSM